MLQDGLIPSNAVFFEYCLVHKVQEVLVSDQVHNGEESLAVMRILEKVIFGHQSNLSTNFDDDIRSVTELVFSEYVGFLHEPSTRGSRPVSASKALTHFKVSLLVETLLPNFSSENDFD
jgi:hypothetical protein